MTTLLKYTFDAVSVAHSDGTHPIIFPGASVTTGPGIIGDQNYPAALALGTTAAASVAINDVAVDRHRCRVRIVFRIDTDFQGRQNLVESDHLPFALFLVATPGGIHLHATVKTKAGDWRGANTQFGPLIPVGEWHTADLVYDLDTVAVFVDDVIADVHAFPQGEIELFAGTQLYVGSWVDGQRDHFNGSIATLEFDADIPAKMESQLDERRSSARWHITYKANLLRPGLDLGEPTEAPRLRSGIGAWYQRYDLGAFMYHPSAGAAFEIHGSIYRRYVAIGEPDMLGFLVTDESLATEASGRKNVFSKGGIYWSSATGAFEVTGQLYLDYENLGESRAWGFPVNAPTAIASGRELILQRARMYHRTGAPAAHEVHGAILAQFLATSGTNAWGLPVGNEGSVRKGSQEIGRRSQFERCTFYWSGQTGAHEVHGDIRRKYDELGGPASDLGFPTSDERDIPGVPGARMNSFKGGAICWYGSYASIVVARPFKLFLASLNTDESEGAFMGQNDLYIKVTIKQGSTVLHNTRYPNSGDWGGRNVRDVNLTFPPVITPDPSQAVTFIVDVWESDDGAPFGGGDDHLGEWTKVLDASNGWGLRENNGILDSGSFSMINNIRASVKPQIDIASLTEPQKFWGVQNRGTDTLTWAQYAEAFRDVDSDTEWWDITDGLSGIFYELVAKGVASGGNCFGMALEAINARKDLSPFAMPLNNFTNWDLVRPQFNVKHQYQVGASAIWWFVGEFLTGNTHDPIDVFNRTRDAAARGDQPVLCISQNYDFSGAPHCILPISWNTSVTPWQMGILDPNFPNQVRTLTVDPTNNTFAYQGGSNNYSGSEWTGGRMHYMPWTLLCEAPRTPVWDAILLLLAGTVIILGDGATTETIKDLFGNDLDAFGEKAKSQLQAGSQLNGYFFRYHGLDGDGIIPGELLFSRAGSARDVRVGPGRFDPGVLAHQPIRTLDMSAGVRAVRDAVLAVDDDRLANRTVASVAADRDVFLRLPTETRRLITDLLRIKQPGDFIHNVRSTRQGQFRYAVKHGLGEVIIGGSTVDNQKLILSGKDLGTINATFELTSDRDGRFDVGLTHKLGVGGDNVRIDLVRVPMAMGKAFTINATPGLGTVDIVSGAAAADVPVVVTSTSAAGKVTREFIVRVDGGTRLTVKPAISEGLMTVSRIAQVRGPVIDTAVVSVDR
jgi:hypothetical protein